MTADTRKNDLKKSKREGEYSVLQVYRVKCKYIRT